MAYDEDLADRLRVATQHVDGLGERRMFGGLAFLVAGHLAVAASGQGGLMVRADPKHAETLLTEPGTEPVVMRGRETRGWLRVDEAVLGSDEELQRWVDVGTSYAASLPPR